MHLQRVGHVLDWNFKRWVYLFFRFLLKGDMTFYVVKTQGSPYIFLEKNKGGKNPSRFLINDSYIELFNYVQ